MHKIPVGAIGNPIEQGTRLLTCDIIPTNVRHLQSRIDSKSSNGAGNNAEALVGPEFLTFFKQQLEPEADSQKWFPRLNRCADRLCQSEAFNVGHTISKSTNAWQNDMTRISNDRCVTRNHSPVFHRLKGLGDTAQVAHAVVNNGDHGTLPPRKMKQSRNRSDPATINLSTC